MEVKLNEPQVGVPILSLTYTGLETEFTIEKLEKRVVDPRFVIIIFAPNPSLWWRKARQFFSRVLNLLLRR